MNNFPPLLSTIRGQVEIGDRFRFSDLLSYFDFDGNPATTWRIRDNGTEAFSGFFTSGSDRLNSGEWHTITAANFSSVYYNAGLILNTEGYSVQVYDGGFWSNIVANQIDTVVANFHPPVVVGTPTTVLAQEVIPASQIFSASDPEGNPITRYQVVDRRSNLGGGQWRLDGVLLPQARWRYIDAADIGGLEYVSARTGFQEENVAVRAFDGEFWSNAKTITVGTLQNRFDPTVNTFRKTLGINRTIDVNQLFSAADADGNTFKQIGIFDTGPAGGRFRRDGVALAAMEWHVFDYSDLERLDYLTPGHNSAENYRIRIYDGARWSNVSANSIITAARPEVEATELEISVDTLERVRTLDFLIQTDIGPGFSAYEMIDENSFADSGRILFQGNRQQQGAVLSFNAGQMNNVQFEGSVADFGRQVDSYLIRANNGVFWTDWRRIRVNTDPVGAKSLETGTTLEDFWDNPDGVVRVPYSFTTHLGPPTANGLPVYYGPPTDQFNGNAEPLSPRMKDSVRSALGLFEQIGNLEFYEVPYESSGSSYAMLFGAFEIDGPSSILAFTTLPVQSGLNNPPLEIGQVIDVWFDSDDYDPTDPNLPVGPGSSFLTTTIHEIGHTLGFNHSFEGSPPLPEPSDSAQNTVMSYTTDFTFHPEEPSTPMLYDIVEAQRLYGVNTNINIDDTHHFFENSHLQMLLDSAGNDTLNMQRNFLGNTIDLHQGTFSSSQGVDNSILIPYGVVIENARGGRGSDTIHGNEIRNLLFGNQGNDRLRGYGGNDVLRGGSGNDTYEWHFGDGRDTIREENNGGMDVVEFHDITGRLNSLEDDFVVLRLGNSLRIDLKLDQLTHDGTVQIDQYNQSGSQTETLRMFNKFGNQVGVDVDMTSLFIGATSEATRFRVTTNQTANGFIAVPV